MLKRDRFFFFFFFEKNIAEQKQNIQKAYLVLLSLFMGIMKSFDIPQLLHNPLNTHKTAFSGTMSLMNVCAQ